MLPFFCPPTKVYLWFHSAFILSSRQEGSCGASVPHPLHPDQNAEPQPPERPLLRALMLSKRISEWSQVHCCVNEKRPQQTFLQPPSCTDSKTSTGQCSIPRSGESLWKSESGVAAGLPCWLDRCENGQRSYKSQKSESSFTAELQGFPPETGGVTAIRFKNMQGQKHRWITPIHVWRSSRSSVRRDCITSWHQSLFAHVGASVQLLQMCESYWLMS